MFAMMLLVIVVGTALDFTPTVLILTPVLMPIVKQAGIDPIYFGVLFIMNNAIGLITPPVGIVLNVVSGVARVSMTDVIRGVNPFLIAQTLRALPARPVPATRHLALSLPDGPAARRMSRSREPVRVTPRGGSSPMKFALRTLAAACAAAVLAAPAAAQFTERTIRISNGINQEHPVGNGVAKMTACATDKSGGKMKLQAFWGGALGGDLQATQALRSGTQEMVITSTSPLIGILPDLGVFDLPFLFANEKEADAVLDGEFGKYISDKMPSVGLVNLSYWENGFRNLTNSRRPVTKVEDFSGLKVRVMQNNVFLDTFKHARRERRADGVPGSVPGAGDQGDRRPGEPVRDHRHLEVLRGAEVPVGDAPRLHAVHGPLLQGAVGQALAGRAERADGVRGGRPRRAAQGLARAVGEVARGAQDARACR